MRKTAKHLYGESERRAAGVGVRVWGGGGGRGDTLCSRALSSQLLEVAEGQLTLSHIQTPGRERLCVLPYRLLLFGISELYSSLSSSLHPHRTQRRWIPIPHAFFFFKGTFHC